MLLSACQPGVPGVTGLHVLWHVEEEHSVEPVYVMARVAVDRQRKQGSATINPARHLVSKTLLKLTAFLVIKSMQFALYPTCCFILNAGT